MKGLVSLSKTRIDKLGERLRAGQATEMDVRELDEYRRSFGRSYEDVVQAIRRRLALEQTGRPAKSTSSIVDKLRRESIRLTQIQDIAGCRLVVEDVGEQERVVAELKRVFPRASVLDRRAKPSHGYRAVHVVVRTEGKSIEIQVRTRLQHLWAELSEKFSDIVEQSVKYGGGPDVIREYLTAVSDFVVNIESEEATLRDANDPIMTVLVQPTIDERKQKLIRRLSDVIARLDTRKTKGLQ